MPATRSLSALRELDINDNTTKPLEPSSDTIVDETPRLETEECVSISPKSSHPIESEKANEPPSFEYVTIEAWEHLRKHGDEWKTQVSKAFHSFVGDIPMISFTTRSNYLLSGTKMNRAEESMIAWKGLKSLWEGPNGADRPMADDYIRITIDNISRKQFLYTHYVSFEDKTLVICEAYKISDVAPLRAYWSDIVYSAWASQFQYRLTGEIRITELSYIGLYSIENETTGTVIKEGYRKLGLDEKKDTLIVRRNDSGIRQDVYCVLTVIPVFKGITRMLRDHANALGHRVVTQIQIKYESRHMSQPTMYPNVLLTLEAVAAINAGDEI
ncbi:hypothetical protein TWF694_000113 [Orbilia ellipsospora]|uniref:START domain-containing protein n=1 Tax=Orbilia ellipsospora TaxID=2528407 RepID=A0AAV9XN06_9PEZI